MEAMQDRNVLQLWACVKGIEEAQPAVGFLENVMGFLRCMNEVLPEIQSRLPQYRITWLILDPLEFGAPITRRRVFILLVHQAVMHDFVKVDFATYVHNMKVRMTMGHDSRWQDLLFPRSHERVKSDMRKKATLRARNFVKEKKSGAPLKWFDHHKVFAKENLIPVRKAAGTLKRTLPLAALQVGTLRERDALDLRLYQFGRFQVINTSQNVHRMPTVYGPEDPLCVLTPAGKYLLFEQQRHLIGSEYLILMGVPLHRMCAQCNSESELARMGGNCIALRAAAVALIILLKAVDPVLLKRYLK